MAWVRRELNALGIPPLKRFGQSFLVDPEARERLVELAQLTQADTVIEVGPGLGFLTEAIIARAGKVVGIEKDRTLAAYLKKKFSNLEHFTIVEADALKMPLPDGAKIVSSPPYNISSKLVLGIVKSKFQLAVLLLQEEFVRRLTAKSGSREYGRISVMVQSFAQASVDKRVLRDAFYPKPSVDSAIIAIKPTTDAAQISNREQFTEMVRVLFTQRRRKLKTVFARYLKTRFPSESEAFLRETSIPEKRVYEMDPRELIALSNQVNGLIKRRA